MYATELIFCRNIISNGITAIQLHVYRTLLVKIKYHVVNKLYVAHIHFIKLADIFGIYCFLFVIASHDSCMYCIVITTIL